MLPLLSYQKLTNHIDGTTAPSATITSGDQSIPNPAFTTWNDFDQRAVILLNSSLTEEAAAEVLGLTTAHAIWTALETAYSNSSVERIHSLRDSIMIGGNVHIEYTKTKRQPERLDKKFVQLFSTASLTSLGRVQNTSPYCKSIVFARCPGNTSPNQQVHHHCWRGDDDEPVGGDDVDGVRMMMVVSMG
ncbi:zinc finger, CCHC-type containing LTR copia-type gag-polypeptide [Tanacetum coccineum]